MFLMEIRRAPFGWKCTIGAGEIDYANREMILRESIGKWKQETDGTATLRVAPWRIGSRETLDLFIEGLGEGMFPTVEVRPVGKVEIERQVW